jgi:flagella basal body P-ring formation protein FlgA
MALFPLFSITGAMAATVSVGEIKAAVIQYVENNSNVSADRVRVTFLSKINDETFPVTPVSLKVSGRHDEDYVDYSSFRVSFYSRGSLLRERSVSVSMEVLTDVVVSVRSLSKKTILCTKDLKVQGRWLKTIPENMAALSEATGKTLTRSIGVHAAITKNMLGEPCLVTRGKVVRIVMDNDVMRVAANGVSEEEGYLGQVIRVKNLSSNRIVYARVTDSDTVRVDF